MIELNVNFEELDHMDLEKAKEIVSHFNNEDYYSVAIALLNRCEDSIFSRCWVTDEQAELLYHTVLYWRDKALMYDMEVE